MQSPPICLWYRTLSVVKAQRYTVLSASDTAASTRLPKYGSWRHIAGAEVVCTKAGYVQLASCAVSSSRINAPGRATLLTICLPAYALASLVKW